MLKVVIFNHSVPGTYTGIVGEAGPEIFSVNRGNVTITPLNSREKMRGIEGVLQDYTGGKIQTLALLLILI